MSNVVEVNFSEMLRKYMLLACNAVEIDHFLNCIEVEMNISYM